MASLDEWKPGAVLVEVGRDHARDIAAQIASSRPPKRGGTPGGSLSLAVRNVEVQEHPWGAVVQLNKLKGTHKLHWFIYGTKGQAARPVDLAPDLVRVRGVVAKDAARHFRELEERDEGASSSAGRRRA